MLLKISTNRISGSVSKPWVFRTVLGALLFFTLAATSSHTRAQVEETGFTLSGKIDHPQAEGTVLFKRQLVAEQREQTLELIAVKEDGTFSARFDYEPGIYLLDFYGLQKVPLAIAAGQSIIVKVAGDKADGPVEITGSPDTDLLAAYERFRAESLAKWMTSVRARLKKLREEINPDRNLIASLTEKEVEHYNAHRSELNRFVAARMGTSIAVYATSLRWAGDSDLPILEELVNRFETAHPNLEITRKMIRKIERFKNTALGAAPPDIRLPDADGTFHSLSDLRGKYALLDFWAAWCPPCRVENPNYARIYHAFRERGFELYSVSLDTDKRNWQVASQRDGVDWINVTDLQGWQSKAAMDYNVTALPANFLLDREGRIMAKNLRGVPLRKKIEEIFHPPGNE